VTTETLHGCLERDHAASTEPSENPVSNCQGSWSSVRIPPRPSFQSTRSLRRVIVSSKLDLRRFHTGAVQALGPQQQQMQLLGGSEAGGGFGAGSPSRNISVPLEVLACVAGECRIKHALLDVTRALRWSQHSDAFGRCQPNCAYLAVPPKPVHSSWCYALGSAPPAGVVTWCMSWLSA